MDCGWPWCANRRCTTRPPRTTTRTPSGRPPWRCIRYLRLRTGTGPRYKQRRRGLRLTAGRGSMFHWHGVQRQPMRRLRRGRRLGVTAEARVEPRPAMRRELRPETWAMFSRRLRGSRRRSMGPAKRRRRSPSRLHLDEKRPAAGFGETTRAGSAAKKGCLSLRGDEGLDACVQTSLVAAGGVLLQDTLLDALVEDGDGLRES